MAYIIHQTFIKVSNNRSDIKQYDVSVPTARIVAIMSTKLYQARRTIHDEKIAGTLINACGQCAAKSAIFLDNGAVVSSPLSVATLMTAIEKANMIINPKTELMIKDPEPPEEPDEEDEDDDDDDDYYYDE